MDASLARGEIDILSWFYRGLLLFSKKLLYSYPLVNPEDGCISFD